MRLAALVATVVSLAECGLGLWLSAGLARPGAAGLAGTVNDAITRLDGLKMLLLALVATAAAVAIRDRTLPLPRWLSPLAAVLADRHRRVGRRLPGAQRRRRLAPPGSRSRC